MRKHQTLLGCVFALFVLLAVPKAEAADALTSKAGALYDEGVAAYKQSKWAEARASFLAAWSLTKHWQIAGSLGDCESRLGLHRDAAEHLAYFLRAAPKDRDRTSARKLYEASRGKIGSLVITVDEVGADVLIDGKLIGKSPLEDPAFVEAGKHMIEARSGSKRATTEVDIKAGAAPEVPLALNAAVPSAPAQRSIVPGAVLGGIAGAALVTGIGLFAGGRAKGANGADLRDKILADKHSCVAGAANYDTRCEDVKSISTDANTFQKAGVGLMIGAGAAAVGAVIYFVVPSAKTTTGKLNVSPMLSLNQGGLLVSGAF